MERGRTYSLHLRKELLVKNENLARDVQDQT